MKSLDLANQQLLGYYHGKWGNLIGMIEEMNLSEKEWNTIKEKYVSYLDEVDVKEIDEHFKNKI